MNSTPNTRYSLIGKLCDPQDVDAWDEFVSIYQPVVFRIARSRGLQHADAVDVTQDVLARVASAISRFDKSKPGATFRGWLYRITRNLVIDFFRRQQKDVLVQVGTPWEVDQSLEPSEEESCEFHREFQRQIFRLAAKEVRTQVQEKTWEAFWLTEVEGLGVEQVGQQLSLSSGAVYVARSRVFAKLRQAAEQRLSETGEFSRH